MSYAEPGLKMWDTFACATAILTHFIILIAVIENMPPDAGLQKRVTFSTLNVGLAGKPAWQAAELTAQHSTTHMRSVLVIFHISAIRRPNKLCLRILESPANRLSVANR
jgi:hypothetical protein